jgi:SAM-dependent methyltransferase
MSSNVLQTLMSPAKFLRRKVLAVRGLFQPFRCPVCKHAIPSFHPLHRQYQEQWDRTGFSKTKHRFETLNQSAYGCPKCKASDRDRLCAMFLEREMQSLSKESVFLDFAPSKPLSRFIRAQFAGNYRTADLFMEDVDDRGVDITDMPRYGTGSVAAFVASHVLEHVADDRKALQELARILSPGGFGLLLAPIDLELTTTIHDRPEGSPEDVRWQKFGQGDHLRLYAKSDFVDLLGSSGLIVDQLGAGFFGPETFRRNGIADGSVLYVVRKRNGLPLSA